MSNLLYVRTFLDPTAPVSHGHMLVCYRDVVAAQIGQAVKEFERTCEKDEAKHTLMFEILSRYEVAGRLIQVKDPKITVYQEYRWAVEAMGRFIVDVNGSPVVQKSEDYFQRWELVARYGDLRILAA